MGKVDRGAGAGPSGGPCGAGDVRPSVRPCLDRSPDPVTLTQPRRRQPRPAFLGNSLRIPLPRRDSGSPTAGAEPHACPTPPPGHRFRGFLLSTNTSVGRRVPRFAPAPPLPLALRAQREPHGAFGSAALLRIPRLRLFPLVFTRCITLGGGCGRRGLVPAQRRAVGQQPPSLPVPVPAASARNAPWRRASEPAWMILGVWVCAGNPQTAGRSSLPNPGGRLVVLQRGWARYCQTGRC